MGNKKRYIIRKEVNKMNFLSGKKTYILMAVLFVAGGLKALGMLDENTYMMLFSLLVPAGLVTLRMGMPAK